MFVATLKFADKSKAPQLMDGHIDWINRGFADGVFVLSGGLQPGLGGAVIGHGVSRAEFEARVQNDPFVAQGVVTAEIIEISASQADERLAFLKG